MSNNLLDKIKITCQEYIICQNPIYMSNLNLLDKIKITCQIIYMSKFVIYLAKYLANFIIIFEMSDEVKKLSKLVDYAVYDAFNEGDKDPAEICKKIMRNLENLNYELINTLVCIDHFKDPTNFQRAGEIKSPKSAENSTQNSNEDNNKEIICKQYSNADTFYNVRIYEAGM